ARPRGRWTRAPLTGGGSSLAGALAQVVTPTGDLGRVDHAGLELVEVRQGDGHGARGRRGMAGLPSKGHEEPGPSRGTGEEGEGEEDASHPSPPPTTAISRTASSNASLSSGEGRRSPTPWLPAESEIGPGPIPTPCPTPDRGLYAELAAFSGRFLLHSDEKPFG